jgi:hypothetical protein
MVSPKKNHLKSVCRNGPRWDRPLMGLAPMVGSQRNCRFRSVLLGQGFAESAQRWLQLRKPRVERRPLLWITRQGRTGFGILLRGWCGWEILSVVGAGWQRAEVVMERRRMRWATVWLVAGVVVTAGCTTGGGTTTPTTTAVTTSSLPTSSSAAPTTTAMTDDEAAIAALQAFYREFDASLKTRQTDKFRATFIEGCRVCREDAATIDSARASGRTFESAATGLDQIVITSAPDAKRRLITALLRSSQITIRDATGKIVDSSPAAVQQRDYSVYRQEGRWLVESIGG